MAAAAAMLLAGCDPTVRATPPIQELSAVEAAAARSQVTGSARTVTTMPPGVFPTLRVTGVVDFRHDRSQTLLEIVRPDGRAAPYARLAREGERRWVGWHLGGAGPRWQLLDGAEDGPEGDVAVHVDGISVLKAVREQRDQLQPTADERGKWERIGGTTPGPDNVTGILVQAMSLDRDGRVGTVEFTLPAMRQHGAFSMTFSEYGEAPPVELPDVGQ